MSKPSAKQVISMNKSLEDEIPLHIPDHVRELYQFLGANGQAAGQAALRTILYRDYQQKQIRESLQSQQHTPTGYAPYIRKRRTAEQSHPCQVPNKLQIKPNTLPDWTPPQPTLPPQEQSQAIHSLPTAVPPPPTPPTSLPPNQPENNPTHAIQPLMSITFTPHTILQIKTHLHQQQPSQAPHRHLPTPRHHFTPQHPHHTPKYQPHPPAPFIQHFTHLLQPIYTVLQTLCHTLHSMCLNTQPTNMWNSIP